MLGPAPAAWLLVALGTAAGGYCLLRMRGAVREHHRAGTAPPAAARDALTQFPKVPAPPERHGGSPLGDGVEAVMGFGMAVMAVPAAALALPAWSWQVWTGVFTVVALHAAWSARRARHRLHHLVGALAMAYMAAVMAWESGPAGAMGHLDHSGSGAPALTGALLLYFSVHVLWSGARLVPAAPDAEGADAAPDGWLTCPELVQACRLSMSIGMVAMLVAM